MFDACPVHPKGTMVIPMLWRISEYVVCMMGVKNKNHHTHPYLRHDPPIPDAEPGGGISPSVGARWQDDSRWRPKDEKNVRKRVGGFARCAPLPICPFWKPVGIGSGVPSLGALADPLTCDARNTTLVALRK